MNEYSLRQRASQIGSSMPQGLGIAWLTRDWACGGKRDVILCYRIRGGWHEMIIGTAGHIDHGKSALIKALTGIDPDRLKEEKRRGITIDLGFANLLLPNGKMAGIVDVPGHERLVHNMLAGAGGVDIAIIVVAADEGVKPQTTEHVEILDLLGVRSAVGVVSKIDLVGEDERGVTRLELEELLQDTTMGGCPIAEVSAITGAGLDDLMQKLAALAETIEPQERGRPFRIPLDRVFTLQGFGTVVTGTPLSGIVTTGQTLSSIPSGEEVRVRSIEVHGEQRETARAGERVALNIVGKKGRVERGELLAERGIFKGTDCMDARLRILRTIGKRPSRALKARLYLGTAHTLATIVPLEKGILAPGGTGYVQIRARTKMPAAKGDRFIVRSEDDRITLGGGIIVDAFAPRHGPKRGATARKLETFDTEKKDQALGVFASWMVEGIVPHECARRLNMSTQALSPLFQRLLADGTLVKGMDEQRFFSKEIMDQVADKVTKALAAYHTKQPLKPLMPLAELRATFPPRMHGVLETTLRELSAKASVLIEADGLRLSAHTVTYSPELERTRCEVLLIYQNAGLKPPGANEAVEAMSKRGFHGSEEVIESLLETGKLVALTHELAVHHEALRLAQQRLLGGLQRSEGITISQARGLLGTTRKYLVPLFEFFDRQGFTVRRGDVRVLSPSWREEGKTGGRYTR